MARNRKEHIFEAAVRLFSTKGYNGTTMRDIAREVGIKESSIYNHYSGKEAIFQSILEYHKESFGASVSALDELKETDPGISDPVGFWMAGVKAFLTVSSPYGEPVSRIILNEMFLKSSCRDFILNHQFKVQRELTEQIFLAMYDKGMLKKCDFKEMACQYIYMIQGLEIENKLKMLEGEDPSEGLNRMTKHMKIFIEGMRK